ncbi:MAG: inositol monophosphatase family protein [Thermodesulfobacteriota bacterium]
MGIKEDMIYKGISKNEARFLRGAISIARKAGQKILESYRSEEPVERGTVKELKTVQDETSDKIITEAIEKNFPEHSYLTEETGFIAKHKDYLWIIDPLDGTGNFANHNPLFAISISLWVNGEPLLGVIEAPMLAERFVAVRKKGAYHYDLFRRILRMVNVSKNDTLERAYVLYCEGGETDKERVLNIIKRVFLDVKDARKLGSAAIELAYVGMGRSDCYITTRISLWDIAAGVLFVKEAGGDILHFDGVPYRWSEFEADKSYDLVASNGKITIRL